MARHLAIRKVRRLARLRPRGWHWRSTMHLLRDWRLAKRWGLHWPKAIGWAKLRLMRRENRYLRAISMGLPMVRHSEKRWPMGKRWG